MSDHPDLESTRAFQPAARNPLGERFPAGMLLADRYRIVSVLGHGGMGEVYRADDLALGQPVALKFLPAQLADDPDRLTRFRREAALARRVSHPHCCRVYDIDEHQGQPFLTMEYVDGEDLASLLRRVGRLPEEKAIQLARELCLALAAVHEQGLLHRDLKPANVMLDGRGKVRLADFGLATAAEDLGVTELRAGTPAYQAPEQLRGESIGVRSDLFALGLVLYELFTGKRAFTALNREEMLRRYEAGPPSKPSSVVTGLSEAVERSILRCLARDPEQRPRSAYEVLGGLPGGDPLQAALEAGETPSPQLVAEAGGEGYLPPVAAGLCLAASLVGLAICVLLQPSKLVARVPLPRSPEVLLDKARDFLKEMGHGTFRDSGYGFDHDNLYLKWIDENDPSANRWDALASSPPAALYFWYRQAPSPLVPALHCPYPGAIEPGRVSWEEPPALRPGMAAVKLEPSLGRLLEYLFVPPAPGDSWEAVDARPSRDPDWSPLFRAAGLPPPGKGDAVPSLTPPLYADRREAWVGSLPDRPDIPIQIEAASYRGQPVYFKVVAPWNRLDPSNAPTGASWYNTSIGRVVAFILLLSMATVLAPWNLWRGRADRAGALRLAYFVFGMWVVNWVFWTRHILGAEELSLLILGLACALYWGTLCWLAYVALEPFARRLWPETLISWSRLLAGRFRDPRVGRDVLIGVLAGQAWFALHALARLAPQWVGNASPVPSWDWWVTSTFVSGYWVGNFITNIPYSIREGLCFWLLFLIPFRAICRKPWLAASLYGLTLTLLHTPLTQPSLLPWLFIGGAVAVSVVVLIRFGVLAVITMYLVSLTLEFPISMNLSAWYARDGLTALGFVLALAGYGFWISLDRRALNPA